MLILMVFFLSELFFPGKDSFFATKPGEKGNSVQDFFFGRPWAICVMW